MKPLLTLLLLTVSCTCGRAQETLSDYRQLVDEAQAAYQADQPRKALKFYTEAFKISKQYVPDLLRATIAAESIKRLETVESLFS